MSRTLLALALGIATSVGAASPPEQELMAEIDSAMLRLADAGLLPASNGEPIRISRPARIHHELGAVLDLAGADADGARVMAVTPGGAAERLGLHSGDRVRSINGVVLHADGSADALREAMAAADGELVLAVTRNGEQFELRGSADAVALPGYELLLAAVEPAPGSSCGRINTFDVFPRRADVYPLTVIEIDGRYAGEGPIHRLEPGRHVVTVAHRITDEFSSLDIYKMSKWRPNFHYKDIELEVRPGVTYRLAAQFHKEHRHEIEQKTFWDPIVFREVAEPCR